MQVQTQAGNTKEAKGKNIPTTSSSISPWLRLKDPRIVRVSRAFGGKDRHSKVCTIRGLRDRRVRLSVPTAIQLYDLQDRLGVNQPSKVVDWLLENAKSEIDELPPLPISPESFGALINQHMAMASQNGGATSNANWEDQARGFSTLWRNSDAFSREKGKEVEMGMPKQEGGSNNVEAANYYDFGQLNGNNFPNLSHFGNYGFRSSNEEGHHQLHGFEQLPGASSTLSLVCPPPAETTTQAFFPGFQMFGSNSENSLNPSAFYNSMSQSNVRGNQDGKENVHFPSK